MAQTDKLAIFVDDMRRLGHLCLPPSINASEAEFSVEAAGDGYAVRYALGALKSVGEKAMEQLVEEREANGPVKSLDDFADRVDPRLLNRRRSRAWPGAGAFDAFPAQPGGGPRLGATRSWPMHPARPMRARAGRGAVRRRPEQRRARSACRPRRAGRWPSGCGRKRRRSASTFSAHPVDNYRHLALAHGARSFSELGRHAGPGRRRAIGRGDGRAGRGSALAHFGQGRRYLIACLSDSSGQYEATVFDDAIAAQIEEAAKAGGCGLLNVELDRRPGEEAPRVTIKSIQSFENLARRTRCRSRSRWTGRTRCRCWPRRLRPHRGGNGQLRLRALTASGEADLVLGRDFVLDAELAARIERLPGVTAVRLAVAEPPRLALVS
jgi:DNA polymerase-3 subunit alpha